jgi:hypothetical protein
VFSFSEVAEDEVEECELGVAITRSACIGYAERDTLSDSTVRETM